MNNHQNAIFHQITNFLKTPLALLGVDLKNFQFNKICHFANHPYLCKGLTLLFLPLFLAGCFSTPAITVDNICVLMDEEVRWYKAVKTSEKKYGVPAYVQLAIIYQESHFESDARPPRDSLFGIIPWTRPSNAYGFAQVKMETWEWYQKDTGNYDAMRDKFADAADFVGWYISKSKKLSKISKRDAYNQYLAYHEGHGGFNRKTYKEKDWLISVAKKVEGNAKRYQRQLQQCSTQLDKNSVWSYF
ncbi:transglycosylase SLT domain-containing protein [Candidatus Thiodubiliella endoseptemdiera]|uniref:transglycosylase SLT domain-containing protein n=1 Tax=Candidatus Thiodubiliella endoseptemdiera TaxID=2738886 RepID=UPI0034DFF0C1